VKEGTRHFVQQRATAVVLAPLGIWFVVSLLSIKSFTYLDVTRFVAQPINAVLMSLLGLTLSYHSYLGAQVVIDDYVHSQWLNRAVSTVAQLSHIAVFLVIPYAVWQIGTGA